jgi:hypothetical protein
MYLNPTAEKFKETLAGSVYVDKTGLLSILNKAANTPQKYICITRPRRFGKTMALNMASAYYSYGIDSGSLFDGLAVQKDESYSRHLNQYDVIFITMTQAVYFAGDVRECLQMLENNIIFELKKKYGEAFEQPSSSAKLFCALQAVYEYTGRRFVFLIDEWDLFLREKKDEASQKLYLDWLRALLKDQAYIGLAYSTGILPINDYGVQSSLNMFMDFTMMEPSFMAPFFGFTEEEVKPLCQKFSMSFEEVTAHYNGYHLMYIDDNGRHDLDIYNPKSIVECMTKHQYGNYWNKTASYEALEKYIILNIRGLKDVIIELMAGASVRVHASVFLDNIDSFLFVDDLLAILVHLGYLAYDIDTETVSIPNKEVGDIFIKATTEGGYEEVTHSILESRDLLEALWRKNTEAVAQGVDTAHQEVSILDYNNEHALSYTIMLAFYFARNYYTIIRELPSGKGFADIAYIPRKAYADKPAMIIELKCDLSAEGAIAQIHNKNYPQALSEYKGNMLLVGINYDTASKKHSCKIEQVEF